MQIPKKIAVVGSGLVGSLLAIYLKKRGHEVDVFDRRPDIRKVEFSGRSINLAMSTRGWKALELVGIDAEIRKIGLPMDKRAIHTLDKPLYFQPYGKEGESIFSISRGLLNRKMVDLAEASGVRFLFENKVWDVDLQTASVMVGESEKSDWQTLQYDLVFGADGSFSRVRHKMQRQSMFNYSQHFLEIGYKELTIPPNANGTHKLDKNSLHIWPRGKFMFIALPNLDGSFTSTLFLPFEGEESFNSLTSEENVKAFFKKHFPAVTGDIPNLVRDFFKNPTSFLVTTQCYPWTSNGKVALIGDAAHAIVPFYGQGMNAGFEDITVLNELMDAHGNNWPAIFEAYQKSRKPDADAIAELSYRNYIEMSTKTADPVFLLQKKIEAKFSEKHPDKWLPLYSMVTFSNTPYSEALKLGDRQKAIMDEVMQLKDIETLWDSSTVEEFILAKLK